MSSPHLIKVKVKRNLKMQKSSVWRPRAEMFIWEWGKKFKPICKITFLRQKILFFLPYWPKSRLMAFSNMLQHFHRHFLARYTFYFIFHTYILSQGLLDISNSSSYDEPSVLDIDNIGMKANEAENALKIIIPTPKSKFSQMRTNLKDQITKNYLRLTAELLKIVNENRFQHFIRICIILNSLR